MLAPHCRRDDRDQAVPYARRPVSPGGPADAGRARMSGRRDAEAVGAILLAS